MTARFTATDWRRPHVGTWLLFAVCYLGACGLQSAFFSKITLLGTVPDLLLGLTVAFSLAYGGRAGAVAGTLAGFAVYALMSAGSAFPLEIPMYFLTGYTVGAVGETYPAHPFRLYAFALACALPVRIVVTAVSTAAFGAWQPILILTSLLPEAAVTFACSLAWYPVWHLRKHT